MPPTKEVQALQQKFHTWMEETFAGSGNPEVHDAWEACVKLSTVDRCMHMIAVTTPDVRSVIIFPANMLD